MKQEGTDFIKYMNNKFKDANWADDTVWSNLKDKFKTTDPWIKRISKVFRVDWSKVFKRGWLLWK